MREEIILRNIDLPLMVEQYHLLASLLEHQNVLDDEEAESLWAFVSCIGDALDSRGVLNG